MKSCLVLVLFASTALAQPAANPAADAALQEGRRLYDVQDWDAAIAKFKEAYKLRPDAASLFNIAQSYRLKGDCASAVIQYRTYKRNYPNERNIDKVDKFIVDLDTCAKTQPVVTPPKPDEPVVTPPPEAKPLAIAPVVPPPMPRRTGGSPALRWGGVAAIGIGAVGLGLGVKFALDGRSAEDDLAKACAVSCSSATALGIESDGRSANTKAVVFSAIGGAAVISGVVMLVLSRGSTEMSVTPTSGGGMAVYTGTFR